MTRLSKQSFTAPRLAIAAGLLAIGGGLGATAALTTRPAISMAPAVPVRISTLATRQAPLIGEEIVTVRGKVAEVYGNAFVVDDGSGRVLIDGGPRGRGDGLVALGQVVSVQGHLDGTVLRPMFLVGADQRVTEIGPRGPHHGKHHGPGRDRADGGPGAGDQSPPPPPPSAPAATEASGA